MYWIYFSTPTGSGNTPPEETREAAEAKASEEQSQHPIDGDQYRRYYITNENGETINKIWDHTPHQQRQ